MRVPPLFILTVLPVRMRLQLEPAAAAAALPAGGSSSSGGGGGGAEGAVLGRLAAARAFLSPNFEQVGGSLPALLVPCGQLAAICGAIKHAWRALIAAHPFLTPPLPLLQLFRGPQSAGMPSAVTKYLGIAAVGTSSGAAFVLLPGAPAAAPGGKHPQQQAQQPPR